MFDAKFSRKCAKYSLGIEFGINEGNYPSYEPHWGLPFTFESISAIIRYIMNSMKYCGATAQEKLDLAVRIASESSVRQASLKTGISRRKIKSIMRERETQVPTNSATKAIRLRKQNPLVDQITKEAIHLGIEKASEEVKERIVNLVNLLYTTAEEALVKTRIILADAAGKDPLNDWKVQQLKHLVSVWGTAIQSGQLLGAQVPKEKNPLTESGDVHIDARQIIFSRIDSISTSKSQDNNQQA